MASASCKACAVAGGGAVLALLGQALACLMVIAAVAAIWVQATRSSSASGRRALALVSRVGLLAKAKAVVSYFQVAMLMPTVFAVELPQWYHRLFRSFHLFNLDWLSAFSLPPACLGGLMAQVVAQACVPLVLLVVILLSALLVQAASGGDVVRQRALPASLALGFAVLPSVSSRIFSVWACDGFEFSPGDELYFVHTDLSVACSSSDADYRRLTTVAAALVVVWPVAVPCAFAALLVVSRHLHPTAPLVVATHFLHAEYTTDCRLWEVAETTRKLALTGFLLLLPESLSMLRLLFALVISIGFLMVLQTAQPFKDVTSQFATAASQTMLCLTLLVAMLFKVVDDLPPSENPNVVFGIGSTEPLAAAIVGFNFAVLGLGALLVMAQLRAASRTPVLRLGATGHRPELTLAPHLKWALFLSHQWDNQVRGTGCVRIRDACSRRFSAATLNERPNAQTSVCPFEPQDVVATIKRQLQLLLPGVQIFLGRRGTQPSRARPSLRCCPRSSPASLTVCPRRL